MDRGMTEVFVWPPLCCSTVFQGEEGPPSLEYIKAKDLFPQKELVKEDESLQVSRTMFSNTYPSTKRWKEQSVALPGYDLIFDPGCWQVTSRVPVKHPDEACVVWLPLYLCKSQRSTHPWDDDAGLEEPFFYQCSKRVLFIQRLRGERKYLHVNKPAALVSTDKYSYSERARSHRRREHMSARNDCYPPTSPSVSSASCVCGTEKGHVEAFVPAWGLYARLPVSWVSTWVAMNCRQHQPVQRCRFRCYYSDYYLLKGHCVSKGLIDYITSC